MQPQLHDDLAPHNPVVPHSSHKRYLQCQRHGIQAALKARTRSSWFAPDPILSLQIHIAATENWMTLSQVEHRPQPISNNKQMNTHHALISSLLLCSHLAGCGCCICWDAVAIAAGSTLFCCCCCVLCLRLLDALPQAQHCTKYTVAQTTGNNTTICYVVQ